jgi:hypothetical protein
MSNTNAWRFQSWVAFVLSFGITLLGLVWLPVPIWPKAFIGIGFLFTVAQCFTLAKTIRDDADFARHPPSGYRDASMGR